ncbi:hypothetical protein [Desulfohalovibrio reitneri]|uniref:hypothetical protein n=1 Tax=Desulfohalovibrio reitneri TaxID=1307759 RepID=UPI0004A78338|nr:hypothetical protein [Desulfohalovibrio reitneri]
MPWRNALRPAILLASALAVLLVLAACSTRPTALEPASQRRAGPAPRSGVHMAEVGQPVLLVQRVTAYPAYTPSRRLNPPAPDSFQPSPLAPDDRWVAFFRADGKLLLESPHGLGRMGLLYDQKEERLAQRPWFDWGAGAVPRQPEWSEEQRAVLDPAEPEVSKYLELTVLFMGVEGRNVVLEELRRDLGQGVRREVRRIPMDGSPPLEYGRYRLHLRGTDGQRLLYDVSASENDRDSQAFPESEEEEAPERPGYEL